MNDLPIRAVMSDFHGEFCGCVISCIWKLGIQMGLLKLFIAA